MKKASIYLITKSLPEHLGISEDEKHTTVREFEIKRIVATGYKVATETGAEIYIPFSKFDEYPVTADFNSLIITAIIPAFNKEQAIEIAEEKMKDFFLEWNSRLKEKEENEKEAPEIW